MGLNGIRQSISNAFSEAQVLGKTEPFKCVKLLQKTLECTQYALPSTTASLGRLTGVVARTASYNDLLEPITALADLYESTKELAERVTFQIKNKTLDGLEVVQTLARKNVVNLAGVVATVSDAFVITDALKLTAVLVAHPVISLVGTGSLLFFSAGKIYEIATDETKEIEKYPLTARVGKAIEDANERSITKFAALCLLSLASLAAFFHVVVLPGVAFLAIETALIVAKIYEVEGKRTVQAEVKAWQKSVQPVQADKVKVS